MNPTFKHFTSTGPVLKAVAAAVLLAIATGAQAQSHDPEDVEALREAAVEALITAPPDRALPLARKVVEGNYSDDLKERALFVLSQIDRPQAQEIILSLARSGGGDLQEEAIRMIGISGNKDALAQLTTLFKEGDEDTRDAVMEAFLIADDEEAVYKLALEADDEEVFTKAVETLGVMGAHEKLRQLRDQAKFTGSSANEALIEAYAISGDFESLRVLAINSSDTKSQLKAIEGLGIVGSKAADEALRDIYMATPKGDEGEVVREAVAEGLMISGNDEIMLELFRASENPAEKRMLLEYLVIMDSDAIWEVIDQALDGGR